MDFIKYPCIYYTIKRIEKAKFSDFLVYQQTLFIPAKVKIKSKLKNSKYPESKIYSFFDN